MWTGSSQVSSSKEKRSQRSSDPAIPGWPAHVLRLRRSRHEPVRTEAAAECFEHSVALSPAWLVAMWLPVPLMPTATRQVQPRAFIRVQLVMLLRCQERPKHLALKVMMRLCQERLKRLALKVMRLCQELLKSLALMMMRLCQDRLKRLALKVMMRCARSARSAWH